jgi:hypothetical protein
MKSTKELSPSDATLGWSRWASRVVNAARELGVWSPTLMKDLDNARKGNPPKSTLLKAGRWLLVEHRRRTYYQLHPNEVPMFARI